MIVRTEHIIASKNNLIKLWGAGTDCQDTHAFKTYEIYTSIYIITLRRDIKIYDEFALYVKIMIKA